MDYLYYILAILVVGLITTAAVRISTRSRNPDLLRQYEARKKPPRKLIEKSAFDKAKKSPPEAVVEIKSLRQRHYEKMHYRTPWGWPGAQQQNSYAEQGISETVRELTNRLLKPKTLVQNKQLGAIGGSDSIRALIEDRYRPVTQSMTEIPYQKVKRPLLRDPNEPHDQLDNLGSAEARKLRKKLQFLSAMNSENNSNEAGVKRKVEFRYVDLKDLKQPWGW